MLRKSDHDFQGLGRVIAVRGELKFFHRFSHAAHLRGGDLVPNGPARDLALGLSEGLQKPGASPSSASQASSIELCTRSQLTGRKRGDLARQECRSRQLEIPARRPQKNSTTPG